MLMSLALAFGITFYTIPIIIAVAKQKRLFDIPDQRKIHIQPIPSIGGVGIFAGFIISLLLSVSLEDVYHFQYLLAALIIIFFIGVKDDITDVPAFKKFLGQTLAACILVFKGGFVISDMDGILGIHEIPYYAAYSISIVLIVLIINAYNLIDGVDGLAATLSLLSSILFAIFFGMNDQLTYACIATSLAGAVGAFLIFNHNPARIFMGDTGSLLIGLLNAVLVIQFINSNMPAASPAFHVNAAPAIGFAILFVPLFDTLRVFSLRILHGESPFTPDKNHIHHILLRIGLNHKNVTFFLLVINMLVPAIAYWLQDAGTNWLILGLLVIGFTTVSLLVNVFAKRQLTFSNRTSTGIRFGKSKIRFISYISKEPASQN